MKKESGDDAVNNILRMSLCNNVLVKKVIAYPNGIF